MECAVCLQNWNSETCVPKSLPCGHSFCDQCLTALFAKQKSGIVCPTCQAVHKMTAAELQAIPKNYSLLALIRDKIMVTKKGPAEKSGLDLTSKQFVPPGASEVEAHDAERETVEKNSAARPFCDKHKMLVHSYVPDTLQLLCDKCISELPKSVSNIRPIPRVCRELRQQITRARSTLLMRKSEIKRYKAVLTYVAETSKKEAESSISEYYQKLIELISESERKTRERFKGICDNQQQSVSAYTVILVC